MPHDNIFEDSQDKKHNKNRLKIRMMIFDNEIRIEQGDHWIQIQPDQWKAMKEILKNTDINHW